MIVLGRIVAPFGVKGWLKIQPFGDDPVSWRTMDCWWLSPDSAAPDEAWQKAGLRTCRAHGKGLIVALEGIADRSAAEGLEGFFVGAPREALPPAGKDEYYWADLTGLAVANRQGESLGTVQGLLSTGVHDVLRVADGDAEYLIPFVAAYVDDVDLVSGRIVVDWQKDW
jgi:16S rRNA processing protein RimM